MQLIDAVNTFARGFSASRSIAYPYLVKRPGGERLFILHDAPRPGKSGKQAERNREYMAVEMPADKVVERITKDGRPRHVVCAIHPSPVRDRELEDEYRALGYRYLKQEPLFVRALPPVPRGGGPLTICRVNTIDEAQAVASAARRRQIDERYLGDDEAPARLFAAFADDAPVGWVCSIRVGERSAWVAHLYVDKSQRGRGVGTALMQAMLRDDHRRGITHSVLTASQAGARVYRKIGYEQVGTVQLFTPLR